jgi:hypothetical protein
MNSFQIFALIVICGIAANIAWTTRDDDLGCWPALWGYWRYAVLCFVLWLISLLLTTGKVAVSADMLLMTHFSSSPMLLLAAAYVLFLVPVVRCVLKSLKI